MKRRWEWKVILLFLIPKMILRWEVYILFWCQKKVSWYITTKNSLNQCGFYADIFVLKSHEPKKRSLLYLPVEWEWDFQFSWCWTAKNCDKWLEEGWHWMVQKLIKMVDLLFSHIFELFNVNWAGSAYYLSLTFFCLSSVQFPAAYFLKVGNFYAILYRHISRLQTFLGSFKFCGSSKLALKILI